MKSTKNPIKYFNLNRETEQGTSSSLLNNNEDYNDISPMAYSKLKFEEAFSKIPHFLEDVSPDVAEWIVNRLGVLIASHGGFFIKNVNEFVRKNFELCKKDFARAIAEKLEFEVAFEELKLFHEGFITLATYAYQNASPSKEKSGWSQMYLKIKGILAGILSNKNFQKN